MKELMIINTVLIWLIIIFLVIKPYLLKLEIKLSHHGFNITKWERKVGDCPNNGKVVVNLRFK